ncbi:hypothetical protein F2Q70_00002213 [Brassica cretica]|uniref:Uncharacterized protein n=1 Tax=Brassica cretica TaxID=69181 RepID=A0A8S9ISM7_BRACR|nr:hypothetical protein F2Q70_00002213 [Brassica cretica]
MHGLMSYRRFGRARSLRSDRARRQLTCLVERDAVEKLGRYVATERNGRSVRARSLHSDRAERTLGRYVATELWLELGRYVATARNGRSVAT